MNKFDGAPLAVGVIRGLRGWDWRPRKQRLQGAYGYFWEPGENRAHCERLRHTEIWGRPLWGTPEPVVSRDCTCGFYAYTRPGTSQPFIYGSHIIGVIEGYGRTQIGELGFRCAKAKIVALAVPWALFSLRREISRRYNVPVYFSRQRMLRKFPLGEICAGDGRHS